MAEVAKLSLEELRKRGEELRSKDAKLAEILADGRRRIVGVLVVIDRQRRVVDHFVEFRGDDFVLLVLIHVVANLDLIRQLVVVDGVGGGHAGADAAVADGFVRVELGVALRAMRRALAEVVEFGLAVRADLLGAQFRIGQGR